MGANGIKTGADFDDSNDVWGRFVDSETILLSDCA